MSAQCPQTLPRMTAKVGEGQRTLNVSMACDFTPAVAHSRSEYEALCEADTALITQRSQVQIVPPLPKKVQVRAGFLGHHEPGSRVACPQNVRRHCVHGGQTEGAFPTVGHGQRTSPKFGGRPLGHLPRAYARPVRPLVDRRA
jgi:hypothetical protein